MMERKFKDNLNTAVFTTKYILNGTSPIIRIIHHKEDGAWEFCGKETQILEEDFRIISLQEAIDIDNSILEVANLPLGKEAIRNKVGDKWEIQ